MARSGWVFDFIAICEKQGARIEKTTKGFLIYPPDRSKKPVAVHKTYSDSRARENTRQMLRRAGFHIPKK